MNIERGGRVLIPQSKEIFENHLLRRAYSLILILLKKIRIITKY